MIISLLKRWHANLAKIVGHVSWDKPNWLIHLINLSRHHPAARYSLLGGLLIIVVGCFTLNYYFHRSKPLLPMAVIVPPDITAPSDEPENIPLLSIHFVKPTDGHVDPQDLESMAASVAPLHQINKDITTGIHLSPEFPGTWHWASDHELTFAAKSSWPPGKTFTLKFDPVLFAPQVELAHDSDTFTTLPFNATIKELKLYQNQNHPDKQEVVASVEFNYPVNEEDFSNHVWLMMQQIKNKKINVNAPRIPFKVTFAKQNRVAYIHSDAIPLGAQPQFVVLVLDKIMKTSWGDAALEEQVTKNVLLPDANSMLKIVAVNTSIVRNLTGVPEQVLTINSSIGVLPQELQKNLKAYILPKDYPATQFEQEKMNYHWFSPDEVTDAILQKAVPLSLTAIPEAIPYPTLNSYRYHIPEGSYFYIKIENGLAGNGGFYLKNKYHTILRAPEYPQEISFLHNGALMALSSEHKLSVLVRGIPAVKFEVNRLLPHEINHLVSQTQGRFNDPYFLNYHFDKNDISEVFSEIKQFNADDPAHAQYTALDLERYLASRNKADGLGLFIISAKAWDMNNNRATGVVNNRLVLVTDMGLIVKTNKDNSHEVYVQSITQGTPVSNANIDILGRNGIAIVNGITDQEGHVHLPSVTQFTDSQEPTVFIARKDKDLSFMPFQQRDRELNYSRFNVGGFTDNDRINNLTAYLFSDRGYYRPGELVNFGIIVKQAYANPVSAGIPLNAVLTDPTGKVVLDNKITTTEDGLLTLRYLTHDNSLTGDYTLTLYIIKDGHRSTMIGSTQIRVAEFIPDTLKIKSTLSNENSTGWVSPNHLSAQINLQNLIGTPAAHRKVNAKLVLSPSVFNFMQYPDYIFHDPLNNPKKKIKPIVEELPSQETDENGQTQFKFNLDRFEKATYQLTFYVQGFEAESGRGVSTQNKILVSPLEYLVGYKTDGDTRFIQQKSKRGMHLIAINNQLKQMAVPDLTVELVKQNTIASLVEKEDGTYQYESVIQELPISQSNVAIPIDGYQYALPTEEVGQFILVITAQDGTILNKIPYTVVGNAQTDIQKNAELTVKLDKESYKPGETIELQMTAPYSGRGLITIERDKVYSFKWFTALTNTSIQTITVPNDLVGDAYVNVSFVRDWNSPEIFISPLSFSVLPFSMDKSAHAIHIDLQIPSEAKPPLSFPIRYSSDKPGKIIIYAVDEGILQVAKYTQPDPLGYFFQKRALSVKTTQILDQILPNYILTREVSAVGGDGSNPAEGFYLNPFKRKTENSVVFWSGILETDQNERTVNFTIPDYFNGTLRVMAVAVNQNAIGSVQKSATVRSDFTMIPNMPTVVAPHDSFDLSVNVINNVEKSGAIPVTVSVETSPGLVITDEKSKKITLQEKEEQVVHFTAKATDQLGNATANFTSLSGQVKSQIQASASVRPATPYQVTLISGQDNASHKTIDLTRQLYPEFLQQNVIASPSPLIFMQGLQLYLDSYPYGCTEQVVSKGFGYLSLALQKNNMATLQSKIGETLTLLRQRQTSQGGFLYWPHGTPESWDSRFSSVYALHFLIELRDKGYLSSNDWFTSGLNYLREMASDTPSNLDDARIQAYAIYLLTRNDVVTTNYLTNLELYLERHYPDQWRKDIASSFMAATYKMLRDDKTADNYITGYQVNASKNNKETYSMVYFFNQESTDALYVSLLAKHFPQQFHLLSDKVFATLADNIAQNQVDTTSAAYTMLAFSTFQPSSLKGHIKINEIFANKTSQFLPEPADIYSPIPFSADAVKLDFMNHSSENFFYQIYSGGFDRHLPKKSISQGLEVDREYWNDKEMLGDTVQQGQDITVHLKIRALGDQNYTHIAMVDLLPSGFEWVPNSVEGEFNYYDVREDRLVFFTTADPSVKEITYHVRPTVKGHFTVPPLFAENMYNQRIMAKGIAAQITVK